MMDFNDIKETLSQELTELNRIIHTSLNSSSDLLNEVVKTYLQTKGKQIRPIIVILSARFFGKVTEEVLNGAASIELLHNASLIHDDVIDETKMRRGTATVNSIWDNHIAVLAGDFFVSNALACAISSGDIRVIRVISDLGKELSTGELDQISIARRHNIDEKSYYNIIAKKTASLFRSCVLVAGYTLCAPSEMIDDLSRFVELLGLCFQIKDDIFDYFKDDAIGKPTGNDLREGKITLPLIHALSKTDAPRHNEMMALIDQDTLSPEEIERLIEFAKAEGGIEYAYSSMERLRHDALAIMDKYPDSDSKRAFLSIFDYIIKRHN